MRWFVLLLLSGVAAADTSIGATAPRCVAVHTHGEGRTRYSPMGDRDPFIDGVAAVNAIEEELARVGFHFPVRDQKLTSVKEQTEVHIYRKLGGPHDTVYRPVPITLDGYDPATKTGFVFLGSARYNRMRKLFDGLPHEEDWYRYELKLFADKAAVLAANDPVVRNIGIFYDPLSANSLADLRAQVRDFARCLTK
jgi:hypothetical protein